MSAAASAAVTHIRPGRGGSRGNLRELWEFRELLYFMVWRDAKVRYKQTVLGASWAILQPLMTTAVFSLFFGRLAGMPSDGRPYALFAFVALVPWTYFSTALSAGAQSLVGGQHLISKVYFPRLIIPIAAVITPMLDFAVAFAMLMVTLAWFGFWPAPAAIALPAFIVLAVASALAASLWCAVLNVEYRDVRYVLPFAIQFWMFATPIAYPASLVPEQWRIVYGLNPMASVVEGFRWALLGSPAPGPMVFVSAMVVAVALAGGVAYFRRMEGTLADVL